MKALVTGGTGFIGSYVVDCLVENRQNVRVFSRKAEVPERWRGKRVEIYRGDLEDFASVISAMEGIDVLYHIGEIKNVTRVASEKNVKLVELFIENLGRKGVKRFVFVSSITVAGIPSEIPREGRNKAEDTFQRPLHVP